MATYNGRQVEIKEYIDSPTDGMVRVHNLETNDYETVRRGDLILNDQEIKDLEKQTVDKAKSDSDKYEAQLEAQEEYVQKNKDGKLSE